MFPNDDMDCILVANVCRNVAKLVDPPVPPRSVINALKLACSDVSAALVALVVVPALVAAVLVSVDVPVIDWIKLCTSAAKWPCGPLLGVDVLPAVAVVLSAVELVPVSDCAFSADIKSFKKFCSACPTSVPDVVLGVDAVELVAAAALDVVEESVTPTDDSAPSSAATKPPPAADGDDEESSLDVVLFCCASNAGSMVDPELATELTLIGCS
jgi:hypothetical protein